MNLREREELMARLAALQQRPLGWRAWCEITILILFASGCSAGFAVALAFFVHPPTLCG